MRNSDDGLLAVRVVAGVHDLLGRDLAVEVEQVDRAPGRRVEEDALAARHAAGELGQVGDAGMGDDQRRLRVAVDERAEPGGDRRQTAPAVDQDRHSVLGGDLEHRSEPLVGRGELLGPRVQLDAACARGEAALGLLERRFVQVEAQERDQPAVRAFRGRERAVVRDAERGVPVGLVEAEDERPRDPVVALQLLELVVVADHPVDVVPEVQVGVEDVGVRRQLPLQLEIPLPDQLERTRTRIHSSDPS